ncbi:17611_t:CDS:2, partial [Funneliformis geosporum]
ILRGLPGISSLIQKAKYNRPKFARRRGYAFLMKPREDVHSLALEERINPSLRNWDEFMVARPKKYAIIRNVKETTKDLVNFCFSLEEKAKSKLKNYRLREKDKLLGK